ncbi:membrane protein [Sulfurifustis variabilis]|uniref:Membrane protein n=1 Tax=Sulfurifustis variabilis TaxID=1675686 RepID=A0A1B4V7D4_9GAMM|nr:hypothetical protein [Sulfurifustis variabilis]BAU49446.1 membrane protein [Sulfurifustis variabilis]
MSNAKKLTGLALATAAAGLFATATVPAYAGKEEAKVHCVGINACKGKSECATASNACKGMNACKGKGMTVTTGKECAAKGGKIEKS